MTSRYNQVKGMLGSKKFDAVALTCSTLYFVFFLSSLGCIVSGQCTTEGMTGITAMKIVTLVLPIIFFAKLMLQVIAGENDANVSMARFQLGVLLAYFFIVFLFLCAQAASNVEAANNINTLALYILPIFVMMSFYSTYEMWKSGTPKSIIYLNLVLAILYYSLFYFSLEYGGSVFGEFGGNTLNGILMAISIVLIFLFAYRACAAYTETNWLRFKGPTKSYMWFCEGLGNVPKNIASKLVSLRGV